CFTDASGPDHRQKSRVALGEHLPRRGENVGAPKERCGLHGKVIGTRVQRAQRRKRRGKSGYDELEDTVGAVEILESMVTQIADSGACGKAVSHEGARRLRQDDLSTMSRSGNPRCTMHIQTDVAGRPQPWLTRVQPHSHPDGLPLWPLMLGERSLRLCGRGNRVVRARENDEEGIALC